MSELIQLKGGHWTTDPKLDRIPSADIRRFNYLLDEPVDAFPLVARNWAHPNIWLNQGQEGACVGFSAGNELNTKPSEHHIDSPYAREIYHWCQRHDEWPGENYSGTSVNAGGSFLKSHGFIDEFRWVFTPEEAAAVIVQKGPVIAGMNWLTGMDGPSASNKYECVAQGSVRGGHAFQLRGFFPANLDIVLPNFKGTIRFTYPVFRICNSWGQAWGINGDAFISAESLRTLFAQNGEILIPMGRHILNPVPTIGL